MKKDLQKLYDENNHWLEDIEFRKKELVSYSNIVKNKREQAADYYTKLELQEMEENLDYYQNEIMEKISEQLKNHKNHLERLLETYNKINVFQDSYAFHYTLKNELESFDHSFQFIKDMVYKHV